MGKQNLKNATVMMPTHRATSRTLLASWQDMPGELDSACLSGHASYDYDPLNRLSKLTDALAGITLYGYDGVDRLVSVTDPKALVTNYSVDGLDNQKQLVSPDTGTANSSYDPAGNLKTRADARGRVSTYVYDALNRVTGVTFSDTTPAIS